VRLMDQKRRSQCAYKIMYVQSDKSSKMSRIRIVTDSKERDFIFAWNSLTYDSSVSLSVLDIWQSSRILVRKSIILFPWELLKSCRDIHSEKFRSKILLARHGIAKNKSYRDHSFAEIATGGDM